MYSIDVDSGATVAAIGRMSARVDVATPAAVKEAAALVRRGFLASSEGRPGPNRISGNHQRSFVVDGPHPMGVGSWYADMGPTMVYSRRLELGWHGKGIYPSLGPGLELARPGLAPGMVARWREAL